jgi:hypothetical protein
MSTGLAPGATATTTAAAATATEVAPTAAATTAVATATATAAAAEAAATGPFFARLGLIDRQSAAIKLFAVEIGNRLVGFVLGGHFHKPEATGFACEFVQDDVAADHVTGLLEQRLEVAIHRIERQIADV